MLKEIIERERKATKGPWKYEKGDYWGSHDEWAFLGPVFGHGFIDNTCVYCEKTDADFIAHARQDIPYLLSIIARMRECLENSLQDSYWCDYYQEKTRTILKETEQDDKANS